MKKVSDRPILDDFDYKLTEEYGTYCTVYDQFCEIEQELKTMESGSEEHRKLLKEAWKTYTGLLQWYHIMVADASVAVADVKNRLTELGVHDLEGIWKREEETE